MTLLLTVINIIAVAVVGWYLWLSFADARASAKAKREEQERRKREEGQRISAEGQRRSDAKAQLIKQWDQVNASPWWIHGIPEHATLVLDSCVLMEETPLMAFWYKMLADKAEEKDWKIIVLKSVYEEIVNFTNPDKKRRATRAKKRISRLQDQLPYRFRIAGKMKYSGHTEYADREIIKYMLSEEGRNHILFTYDRELKIRLIQISQNDHIFIPNEVRTCDNLMEHYSYPYMLDRDESKKSAYVVTDIETYLPNAEYSLKKNGLEDYRADELRRFVEWSIIKLNIVE